MNARTVFIVCLLLALPVISVAQGKGHGVELVLTSPKLVEVEPGRIVTASYLVSNRTESTVELMERLDRSLQAAEWQPVMAYERPITLAAGAQKVQLVTFMIPRNYPAGKYEMNYSILDRTSSEVVAVEGFSVVVKPVIKLDAVVEDKPDVVLAGDEYRVHVRLVNNGNSAVSMKAAAKSSPELPVAIDPAEVTLEAGSSRFLNFSVKTDQAIKSKVNHVLEVNVLAEAPQCGTVSLARTVFVEILPRLFAAVDLRNTVPTQASLIEVGQNEEAATQVEYAGSGSLDENGTRKIDFLFRGPDATARSVYGTRDVLHFSYSDPTISLFLGDQLYSLSPLSELLTYGRGGGVSLHPGGAEIGSSYSETRWDLPQEKEIGAFAGYRFGQAFKVRANYLNKYKDEGSTAASLRADIYSVQMQLNPSSILDLGLEYARSYDASNDNSNTFAHRATLQGNVRKRVWYAFENTYAAPDFLGYYRDVIYSNGTISADIYRNLRSHLSYRVYDSNLDIDPRQSVASREREYLGGLSYTFASGTNASLDYEALDRKDVHKPAQFDFAEDVVKLGLGRTYGSIGVQSYAEGANLRNRILGETDKALGSFSLYTYYRPSPSQSYTLFTRIGHNSFTGDPERTMNVGVSAWLRLKDKVNLNISYQKNNIDSDRLPLQDYLFSSIDVTLPNKHSVSLKVRWFKFENVAKDDYAFFAAYNVPFSVPAMKKRSFGSLEGTVIDKDQANAASIPKVLISIDNVATMTNERGEFSFPVLKPGKHQLMVDQRSMGMSKITTENLPIPVEIAGGETTVQKIGITEACEISGKVVLFALDPRKAAGEPSDSMHRTLYVTGSEVIKQGPLEKDDLIETGGVEQVVVELSNGEERMYQRTDEKGRFSFKALRPGAWHLRIDTQNLPPLHILEKTEFEIELTHGEKKEITAHVLPRLRSIQFLQGGKISLDGKKGEQK